MPQTSDSDNPESMLPSLDGFADEVRAAMQTWDVPGLAVAIIKDGNVIFSQGFGKRDLAKDLEVTPQTLFAIGSCTKAFTTAALGMLSDEGKLDWDTPIREYLPSFKLHDTFATERMTARDITTHRSGLPRHDLMWYHARPPQTRQEIFDNLQYLEPSKDFRTVWQYQNMMYMTAGLLVEKLSGLSWEKFVEQRIFTPLGMTSSTISPLIAQQAENCSTPYKDVDGETKETELYAFPAMAPAGSIFSNVEEMAKWVQLQLRKGKSGETQLISEAQILQMHTPQMVRTPLLPQPELSFYSYGLGWRVSSYRGHTMVDHGGSIDGFGALTTLLPGENIGIVVLTNKQGSMSHTVLTYTAIDRLLGLELLPWNERLKGQIDTMLEVAKKVSEEVTSHQVPDTHPSHPLADYTGDFEHPAYGMMTIDLHEEQLQATFNETVSPLRHLHYDIFVAHFDLLEMNILFSFATNKSGDIESLAVPLEPAVKDIVFKRVGRREGISTNLTPI